MSSMKWKRRRKCQTAILFGGATAVLLSLIFIILDLGFTSLKKSSLKQMEEIGPTQVYLVSGIQTTNHDDDYNMPTGKWLISRYFDILFYYTSTKNHYTTQPEERQYIITNAVF